ncbi:helix-turn-helix domain-containing protein [Dactylosporangium sp. AC04546]|uniref:helix-turn-helix domain-containing protein n=1 Tax=Dactylosporangium sp. AC04546 TaxID=2862460 RepID=UPI001EDDC101|nr:helix-turn-helix domain-containing protein [Dactylosporangium sp. AC04546]WVK86875.1 helix-turn-helix domain-containing protein [Dactylosporangium sp. AC04546]
MSRTIGAGPMAIDDGADCEHVLIWVDRGRGELRCAGRTYNLAAGEAAWIPAGAPHRFDADPGAVCFPISVPIHHVVARRREPYRVAVPPGWRDWLIHRFTVAISPLRQLGPPAADLGDLLRAGSGGPAPDVVLPLPRTQLRLPTSPALSAIGRRLMHDPAHTANVGDLARQAGVSPRTLQRRFLAETAVTFEDWRIAVRLLVATGHLAAGYPLGLVADRVGFQSTSGFSRAFTREFGLAPRAYAALARDRSRSEAAPDRRQVIPPSATPPLVNNFHVVIWMYRGRSRVHVGPRSFDLGPGDAIWLPAGIENRVEVAAGAIMMPLQSGPPPTLLTADAVRVLSLRDHDEAGLLRMAVAHYTWLRPPGYDEIASWHAVERWLGPGTAGRAAARTDAANRATLETARRLLTDGARPAAVADRLGYAHLSSFSRAFSRQYGTSPRAFQRSPGPG